jgi:cation:H+ antiporter
MLITVLLLLGSAVVIYLSCEFFVNGVEWVGLKTGVGQTAVGTLLAAFGTALPESVVTLVAVAFSKGSASSKDIGVGAALGGPLVLGTLAYAVVGLVLLLSRKRKGDRRLQVDGHRLARDQGWFLLIFAFKVALGLVAFAIKPWLGFLFLAAYAGYVWVEMRAEEEKGDIALEPLKFRPSAKDPGLWWALFQTVLALAVTFAASQLFVHQLEKVGPWLGLSPTVVALLMSPIATELPETMNAIIWVRQGKERLAFANISGAMMIQATIPSAFGLFFTPWRFDGALILAAAVTTVSVAGMFTLLRRGALTPKRLASFGLLYGVFALLLPLVRAA